MRRKRSLGLQDSLDMLLDTITNTFGGILLITMLLVLQVRDTDLMEAGVAGEGQVTEAKAEVLRSKVAALRSKKESLEISLELQGEFSSEFTDPAKQDLAAEVAALIGQGGKLRQQAGRLDEQLWGLRKETSDKEVLTRNRGEEELELQKQLKEQLDVTRSALESLREQRTKTMELPKEQLTSKTLTPVFLTADGFFVFGTGAGALLEVNTRQFASCDSSEADILWGPKSYQLKGGSGCTSDKAALARALSGIPPSENFLLICVRESGFERFAAYRELLVELGYEHQIFPGDDPVVFSFGRGKPNKAQ